TSLLRLRTDDGGRFCVRIPIALDRYVAHLAWGGSQLVDGAKVDLQIDLSRRALVLRFDPEPRVLMLTSPAPSVDVSAVIDDNGGRTNAPDAHLVLTNERGTVVDEAITNGAGRARFAFDPSKLGPPGRGELRAAFNGNADTAASVRVAEIERHTKV